jgi:steroid 5-alpha reductase family enzyme
VSDFATSRFLTGLVVSGAAVAAVLVLTWVVARRLGRYNVIDVAWGLGFVAVAVASFLWSNGEGDDTMRVLVLALVAIWGVRLGAYIAWRSRGHGEDPRYAAMLDRAPGSAAAYAATRIFVPQGVAMWFISLPVQVAMFERDPWPPMMVLGALVWVVGFGFESIGDAQLARFKADPANRGQVMDRGLWRFTRHPNYFGDACLWWGIFLVACAQWQGVLTVLSPVLMTWTLVAKTGKALLEQDIGDRRPGYADYVARTSGFFPLPPGRAAPRA